jgi:quinol monooxygenase YgiN
MQFRLVTVGKQRQEWILEESVEDEQAGQTHRQAEERKTVDRVADDPLMAHAQEKLEVGCHRAHDECGQGKA